MSLLNIGCVSDFEIHLSSNDFSKLIYSLGVVSNKGDRPIDDTIKFAMPSGYLYIKKVKSE